MFDEIQTGETSALFKGPVAPVTSVCLSPDGKLLFAGCWDKTVWSWDVASGQPRQKYEGHTDFVKSVISARLRGEDLLITGGADAQVLVFNIASGERIETFRDHTRGIQDLAFDPELEETQAVVFSAGSDREIRQFKIFGGGETAEPLLPHDTSVYKLFFDNDGDLWTASADKTAKCLVRSDGWKPNLSLEHPDFVRDIVVYETGGWIVTACRDEEVRVWNRSVSLPFNIHDRMLIAFRPASSITLSRATSRKSPAWPLWVRLLPVWELMAPFASGLCDLMSCKRPWSWPRTVRKKKTSLMVNRC